MAQAPLSMPPTRPAKKKSRLGWFIVFGLLILVGAGITATVAMKKMRAKVTLVTTEKAVIKTITQLVSATGKIQPEVEVKIAPEVAGEIMAMPLREGDKVKKGDLLLTIKSDFYRFQVDQQQAGLAAARATELDAKVRLVKAAEDFHRSEKLFDKHLIADADLTAAKTTFEAAQANLENAKAQINRAEGLVRQAQDQLEKTTIFSPIEGTVSSRTSEVGERVVATGQFTGTEVMRIADLSNMEVRVNVNENDIVNVKEGDVTRITIDAFPNRKFAGVVKEIASSAQTSGAQTQEEVTNFLVKIRIADRDPAIRPGMSASVEIETRTVKDVVAVPTQSVTVRSREGNKTLEELAGDRSKLAQEKRGDTQATVVNEKERRAAERADREALQRVVFVVNGDTVKMVPVETGIADATHTEIKSGVKDGDEVVVGSFSVITRTLKDGMKVRVEKPKTPGEEKK